MLIKQFQAISLSHRTASVSVRERAALNEKQTRYILSQVRDLAGIQEILILSTCNRTEIYYNSAEDHSFLLIRMLAIAQHKISYCEIAENATFINDHDDAARHLFRVAMGLDSQVIGDLQISHQVKNAYQWSADAQLAGPFLHRLMHTIFFTNKRVTQETEFRDGAASVSYAAAELANDLSKTWVEPQVLVIGLGEMGSDVARNLKNFSLKNVTLANRTFEKAEKLATECNFNAIPLNKVHQSLIDYDIVISAIASPEPFLKKEHLQGWEAISFKHFIDLSVPRSIDMNLEEVVGVLLYNIDEIQQRTASVIEKRKAAIPKIELIIEEALQGFGTWTQEMAVSPTIQRLKNTLEEIRKEEVARHLKKASQAEVELLEEATKSMMQKIIKLPVLQLKAACKRGEADTLVDVLNDLFNLGEEEAVSN